MTGFTRRRAILGATALFASPLFTREIFAQPAAGPFTLAPLPYAADANEPHIDAQTMTIHHDRHHAAYVTNLNAAVKDHSQVAAMKLQDILAKLPEMPEAVRTAIRNNGGGHANHTMFWQVMGGKGGEPTGDLAGAITRDLGGMEKLKADFNRAGLPSLGELVSQAKNNLAAPWLGITAFCVLGIVLTLLIFVGEAVRDAFDPRKQPNGGGK